MNDGSRGFYAQASNQAAMYEAMANFGGGPPDREHYELYSKWASGGWGMIITGKKHLIVPTCLSNVPRQCPSLPIPPFSGKRCHFTNQCGRNGELQTVGSLHQVIPSKSEFDGHYAIESCWQAIPSVHRRQKPLDIPRCPIPEPNDSTRRPPILYRLLLTLPNTVLSNYQWY